MSFQFFRISFYPSGFVHKDLSGYIPKMMMVIYLDIQPERERNIRANDFNSIIVMVDFPLVNQHYILDCKNGNEQNYSFNI